MIKQFVFLLTFILIGSLMFTSAEVKFGFNGDGQGNDWGIIDFNYHLPSSIVTWLEGRNFVNDVTLGNGYTRITYDLNSVENDNVKEVVNSYDYQRTHLKHQEINLQGYNMPLVCGRDTVTNELYKIQITNGQIRLIQTTECIT